MSSFVRDSLIQDYHCDASRIAVVGAAPNTGAPESLPDNGGYSNRTILFIGIDWERKGGPALVEAFRKVLERLPDARLVIAGCSPRISVPNVEVLGRVPLSGISRLLLKSSVVALPSLKEPQGIAPIEAMTHGIPVVASNIGSLPEVIEDGKCGRIVPLGDTTALASAFIDLLSDPALCRRYGEAARERARASYSSPVVSKKIGDAIRAALGFNPSNLTSSLSPHSPPREA
jgi:glycosyltransferase involved in cell wall biosynthesis